MRAIGIDLGSKRIGVALSDAHRSVATPLQVLKREGNQQAEHQKIAALAAEWEAEIIVVGMPYNLNGSLSATAKNYLREVESLKRNLAIEVVTHDERLTTVSAERSLIAQDMKASARRQVVDQVAAAVMLQSWLDAGG